MLDKAIAEGWIDEMIYEDKNDKGRPPTIKDLQEDALKKLGVAKKTKIGSDCESLDADPERDFNIDLAQFSDPEDEEAEDNFLKGKTLTGYTNTTSNGKNNKHQDELSRMNQKLIDFVEQKKNKYSEDEIRRKFNYDKPKFEAYKNKDKQNLGSLIP